MRREIPPVGDGWGMNCEKASSPGTGSEILDGFGYGFEDRGVARKAEVIVIGEGD